MTRSPLNAEASEPGGLEGLGEPDLQLTRGDVEAIAEATARRLVELIGNPPRTFGLVGAREVADGLGVSVDYVYAHAVELGAMRLGGGPKARIRFDLDRARQALEARRQRVPRKGGRRP